MEGLGRLGRAPPSPQTCCRLRTHRKLRGHLRIRCHCRRDFPDLSSPTGASPTHRPFPRPVLISISSGVLASKRGSDTSIRPIRSSRPILQVGSRLHGLPRRLSCKTPSPLSQAGSQHPSPSNMPRKQHFSALKKESCFLQGLSS